MACGMERFILIFAMVKKVLIFAAVIFFNVHIHAHAGFPVPYSAEKDITDRDITFTLKENSVTVSYSRPAVPMKPFDISFKFRADNVKSLSYSTNMKMNMGRYIFFPKPVDGIYSVTPVLPKCGSGSSLWYGKLDITYKSGATESLVFFYNVK